MKSLLILAILCATNAIALTRSQYADLYATTLINQFDEILDQKFFSNNRDSVLESDTYYRLLAARSIKEEVHLEKDQGLISYKNIDYRNTINEVNKLAEDIKVRIKHIKNNSSVIYPSISGSGNLTGNTYPNGVWSLTYDDGPHPSRTKRTVDNVYSSGFNATYFILTENAYKHKDVVQYVLDANMELALHSYTHRNLSSSSRTEDQLIYEIDTAKVDLEKLTDRKIKLFRLPYGAGMRKKSLRARIADNGLIHVFWNVDTLDWKDKNPESIVQRSLKQMMLTPKKGGIILFHDIHNQSVIASKMLTDKMLDDGLKLCTVGNMVKYFNNLAQDCL